MTKFAVGDRVKCVREDSVNAGIKGRIYTVTDISERHYITISPNTGGEYRACDPDRFELYAKAGEFVVGDWVVFQSNINGTSNGKPYAVTSSANGHIQWTDNRGRRNGCVHKHFNVRLATPEEIAAATTASEPKKFNRIYVPPGAEEYIQASNAAERTEIPAAEFDFSKIKAGDTVVLRWTVNRGGFDSNGYIRVHQPNGGGDLYVHTDDIESVTPAPKPKTLRERAIERVFSGIPGAEAGDETKGVVLAGGQVISLHAIVDAVLAEVEKG